MKDVVIRKLDLDTDLILFNEFQWHRGFKNVRAEAWKSWIAYGAIADDRLVSVGCLCIYDRMPDVNCPNGVAAELCGVYTQDKYEGTGIDERIRTALMNEARERNVGCIIGGVLYKL